MTRKKTARNLAAHGAQASAPPATQYECQTTFTHCNTITTLELPPARPVDRLKSSKHPLESCTYFPQVFPPLCSVFQPDLSGFRRNRCRPSPFFSLNLQSKLARSPTLLIPTFFRSRSHPRSFFERKKEEKKKQASDLHSLGGGALSALFCFLSKHKTCY